MILQDPQGLLREIFAAARTLESLTGLRIELPDLPRPLWFQRGFLTVWLTRPSRTWREWFATARLPGVLGVRLFCLVFTFPVVE